MPRVSILMPTHNRAHLIGYALDSVLQQTADDFELLVVADGCTDGTTDVVAARADPRIRFFDLPKAPYFGYANRNIALQEARGEFVAFAAHDNILFPDHIERLTALLERTGVEWAYSRPLWVSSDGVIVPSATNLTNSDELDWFLTIGNTIPATCIMFRRSCLEKYGFVPENVPAAADWRHWIAMIEGGGRTNLAYEPTPTCLHFCADWRQSRHADSDDVRALLEVADSSPWWPAVLRHEIPAGSVEQTVLWEAMRRGGPAWIEAVRRASTTVIDRIAWDGLRDVRPRLQAARERVAVLEVSVSDLTATRAQLEAADAALARAYEVACDDRARLGLEVTRLSRAGETANERARAAQELLAGTEARLAAQTAGEHAVRVQLAATLRSVSWRLTSPLRTFKRLVRSSYSVFH